MKPWFARAVIAHTALSCVAAYAFSPDAKELCKTPLSPQRMVAKLFDDKGISDWQLDTNGALITPDERTRALTIGNYCVGRPCAEKGQEKLTAATAELEQFLKRIRSGNDPNYHLTKSVPVPDLVDEYLLARQFDVVCTPAGSDSASTNPPGDSSKEKTFADRLAIRGTVTDLVPSFVSYKSLSSASFSADRDSIADKSKYAISGAVGYLLDPLPLRSLDTHIDVTPYLAVNLKKTVSTPAATGNTNVQGIGLLFDTLIKAGFHHEFKLAPQIVRDFEDKSNTALAVLTYLPEPSWPTIGAPFDVGNLLSVEFRPSISYTFGDVLTKNGSTSLGATGHFDRYGGELDVRLYGWPNSVLEPFTLAWSGVRLQTSGEAGYDVLRNSMTSLRSSLGKPTARPTGSISLKYTTGRDLSSLQPVRELVLGLGVKY